MPVKRATGAKEDLEVSKEDMYEYPESVQSQRGYVCYEQGYLANMSAASRLDAMTPNRGESPARMVLRPRVRIPTASEIRRKGNER